MVSRTFVCWLACALLSAAQGVCADDSSNALSLTLRETHTQCELLGLGAQNTVPYNFPGLSEDEMARHRALNPGLVEPSLPAGDYAQSAAIVGGDMGAAFMHGDGKLYLMFGDAWFDGVGRTAPPANGGSAPNPMVGAPVNDDLLASVDLTSYPEPARDACLPLEMAREAESGRAWPTTWNGLANDGGHPLGATLVPGPGFSTGKHMFIAMTVQTPTCGETGFDCAAANGLASDQCLPSVDGLHRCYFGECKPEPDSPCALRLTASTLLVRRDGAEGTDFTEPRVGEHITSATVLEAYRGHFATMAIHSEVDFDTGDGRVWVVGRDSFWGAPGLTMSPYLMYHPVHAGMLAEPRYFAGMQGNEPVFTEDADAAKPLYDESQVYSAHTSLVFEPAIAGGLWLMAYGGHAQPVLRDAIGVFVRPVVDEAFYDVTSGVQLRWAKQPWGPWSEPVTIFNPYEPSHGGYCEHMYFDDPEGKSGWQCAENQLAQNATLDRATGYGMGGEYGAAIVPGFSEATDHALKLRWLVSTWNPYRVLMLESTLDFVPSPSATL
ncbi:MAG: hypothetical protein ABW321_32620 [Polyangiales bacterium]